MPYGLWVIYLGNKSFKAPLHDYPIRKRVRNKSGVINSPFLEPRRKPFHFTNAQFRLELRKSPCKGKLNSRFSFTQTKKKAKQNNVEKVHFKQE